MLQLLGRWILDLVLTYAQMLRYATGSLLRVPRQLRLRIRPVGQVLLKQVYFTGLESLKVIVPVSMAVGTVIIAQVMALVGAGNESLSAKVLIWTVLRELGPLLTALIVISRSGTAIATELGAMKIAGEITALEALGIPPEEYLVLPRVLGVTLSVFVLTVYFEIGAIFGGFLVAFLGWHLPYEQFSQGVYAALTLQGLLLSGVKSLVFGLCISAACCQQGLAVGRSATMIPQAATRGVMHSLFLVFILDGIITVIAQRWPLA